METKICSTCKQEKDINEFSKSRAQCKNCRAEQQAQYYSANKEKIAELTAQYRAANKEKIIQYRFANREKILLGAAKKRAQQKGLDFNITEEDILIPERCPILGYKLKPNKGVPGKASPSLDRIDNNKGYVKGNVRVISHRANAAKGDFSLKELKAIVKDLERQQNERR